MINVSVLIYDLINPSKSFRQSGVVTEFTLDAACAMITGIECTTCLEYYHSVQADVDKLTLETDTHLVLSKTEVAVIITKS